MSATTVTTLYGTGGRRVCGDARGNVGSREIVALANWGGHGRRAGWTAVLDPDMWIRALLVVAIGVVSMAVLACIVALVRDTTGHDWYATGKLILAEVLIELDFDHRTPVEYRTRKGAVVTLARGDIMYNGEALAARYYLVRTTTRAMELGVWCGLGGALLCLALIRRPKDERRNRRTSFEPDHVQRPEAQERFAPPAARPGFVALPPAKPVPVRASEDRSSLSNAPRPPKPEPTGGRRGETGSGKDDAPAPRSPPKIAAARDPGKPPTTGADAGRQGEQAQPSPARRKRKYGRWI